MKRASFRSRSISSSVSPTIVVTGTMRSTSFGSRPTFAAPSLGEQARGTHQFFPVEAGEILRRRLRLGRQDQRPARIDPRLRQLAVEGRAVLRRRARPAGAAEADDGGHAAQQFDLTASQMLWLRTHEAERADRIAFAGAQRDGGAVADRRGAVDHGIRGKAFIRMGVRTNQRLAAQTNEIEQGADEIDLLEPDVNVLADPNLARSVQVNEAALGL